MDRDDRERRAAGSIGELDERLRGWAGETVEGLTPGFDAPAAELSDAVSLYLLDVVPKPPARGDRRPPLQAEVRYLVTTWAGDPATAHAALGDLFFGALQHPDVEVEPLPVPVPTWSAFGVPPRPSFVIKAVVRKELEEPPVKLVRQAVFTASPMSVLHGVVLTQDDVPIPRARVDLPALDASTTTDSKGRFAFPRVPSEPPTRLLHVSARGRQATYEADAVASPEDPLVLRFEIREG